MPCTKAKEILILFSQNLIKCRKLVTGRCQWTVRHHGWINVIHRTLKTKIIKLWITKHEILNLVMHQSCKNVTKMRVHVHQLLPSATVVAERLCFHKRLSFCPLGRGEAGGVHGRGRA